MLHRSGLTSIRGGMCGLAALCRFPIGPSGAEDNLDMLREGIPANGLRWIREACRGSAGFMVVDVDDVRFLADGHRPGGQYCGHVGHRCFGSGCGIRR